MASQRLTALRALMASQANSLAAYVVPTADAHNSEYISPADSRREWLSGFTGSAGTAVVTDTRALVWTDGRYYTQFEKEVDLECWSLMKLSLPETPSMDKWLATNIPQGSYVGVDPTTITKEMWNPLQTTLNRSNIQLIGIPNNLVDETRTKLGDPPPKRENNPLLILPLKYTGKSCFEKIQDLREQMREKKAAALVITALDEIAYTLNLRGTDIKYNPIFFSYLIIKPEAVILFRGDGTLTEEIKDHFKLERVVDVCCEPYDSIFQYLERMAVEILANGDSNLTIWLSHQASEAIHTAAAGGARNPNQLKLLSEVSPVALAKVTKNEVELKGFRDCHIRDGTAVVRFLCWLHEHIAEGDELTELDASAKLLEFRQSEVDFMGASFETIAGAGENGAVIHYSPSKEHPRTIKASDMFLLDSGGQYRDGTTDITRTRHMSASPSASQKAAFTRVLKGQIAVATSLFPKGVKGNVLDSFARKALWDVGCDYAHGTGHGVGHFLNVHEGPSGISWRSFPDDPGLKPNMIFSNEPGFYVIGQYGIRHEDLLEIIEISKDSDHPKAKSLVGDYDGRGVVGFNTLTLVPHQRECIDVNLLDDFELKYTNDYHKKVLDTIGPILKSRGLLKDLEWLRAECAPLTRK